MKRRQVLASVAAALPAAAGCVGGPAERANMGAAELPTAVLSMAAVDDAAIAGKFVHDEMGDEEQRLLARVVAEGPATVGWYQEPPLHTQRPLAHDGDVYDVSRSVVERRPATNYSVKVDIPQRTPEPTGTVQFAELPAADRAVFEREGLASGEVVGIGTVVTYTPDQEADSVLVPEPEYDYVDWADGETAEWVVDDSWETEQHRYRFAADRISSTSAYGAEIRREHAFAMPELSDAERDVVETAVAEETGYTVAPEATPSSTFRRLAERFRPHPKVAVHDEPDPGLSGTYLLRYDGTVYWTGLRVPEDEGDDTPTSPPTSTPSTSSTPSPTQSPTSTPSPSDDGG